MDEEIKNKIYECTQKRCIAYFEIKSGDGLRKHFKVILDDKSEYLCKLIQMSDERIQVYKRVANVGISCFQKTYMICLLKNDTYLLLVEWNSGKLIREYLSESREYDVLLKIIGNAAREIRRVHSEYMILQKVEISQHDVEKLFEKNRDLLTSSSFDMLKKYVLENYRCLNGRPQTIIHGDLHIHNILETSVGMMFIDIDDCGYGDPYMDLIYASNLIKTKSENRLYYEFLMKYFDNHIPEEFWVIVNIYSIYKALHIMRCEKKLTSNNKPIYSLDNFICQHKMMTSHEPLWFEEMTKEVIC